MGGLRVGRANRICILIRRRAWIDGLRKVCGDEILDEGTAEREDEKDLQPVHVGHYIAKLMDGSVEQDLGVLLDEVSRLRQAGPSK